MGSPMAEAQSPAHPGGGPGAETRRAGDDGRIGVYVHVPFCERVCPYCDFAVTPVRSLPRELEDRFADAVIRELELALPAVAARPLETVYLGGGTPSLLRPNTVARLVGELRRALPGPGPREVTLELNPGTVERSRIAGFREAGVDRLSVGVQSFDDRILKRLGRAHRATTARAVLEEARRVGFPELSADLLYGVPGQEPASLEGDLRELLAFGPTHVSAYALEVGPGTPYARGVARGVLRLPSEEAVAAAFLRVEELLAAGGLRRYEVSNFARPGHEAVHNRRYWLRRPVLGLGPSAVSSRPAGLVSPFGSRATNPRALGAWLEAVEAGDPEPFRSVEIPTPEVARGEAAFLALRTGEGLSARDFEAEFGAPPRAFFARAIDRLCGAGLLEETPEGDLRLTPGAWLLADSVAAEFVAPGQPAG